jgi:hypothetical protein
VALSVLACGGSVELGGVTLLRYGLLGGGPTALAAGTLRIRDGCVTLEDEQDNPQVVLWPAGTTLAMVNGRLSVVLGSVAAADSQAVRLGGGQYTDAEHRELVEGLVGPLGHCISPQYWLATTLSVE